MHTRDKGETVNFASDHICSRRGSHRSVQGSYGEQAESEGAARMDRRGFRYPETESGEAYEVEQMSKLMGSPEQVKGQQFNLMLDKALKHGKLMNHWLEKARKLMEAGK